MGKICAGNWVLDAEFSASSACNKEPGVASIAASKQRLLYATEGRIVSVIYNPHLAPYCIVGLLL